MLPRSLLMFGLLFAALLPVSPAHAEEEDLVTITGTVWIDENADGIRQPSEPVVPSVQIYVRGVISPLRTDGQGRYTVVQYPYHRFEDRKTRGFLFLEVYYKKPAVRLVRKRSADFREYTHRGCARVYLPGSTERRADIRLLHYKHDGWVPMNWPLDGGRFFKEAVDADAVPYYRSCDAGFAVTNAAGIPFWDTWQVLGLENAGYPVSHRFKWKGFVTQVFEKAVLQWQPGRGVLFVDVFDELRKAGKDEPLKEATILDTGEIAKDGGLFPEDEFIAQPPGVAGLPSIVSPASAPRDKWITVGGTIWVDENLDGMRQPSEPVVPGVRVYASVYDWSPAGYHGITNGTRTDHQGNYRFPGGTTESDYHLSVYYLKPGAEPVRETSWGLAYTHYGCAYFYVPSGKDEFTLDIRTSQVGQKGGSSQNWPLVDGHFFREKGRGCDTGFSVTNADGIPFWDTWQRFGRLYMGYPVSHRFTLGGFLTQAFERVVLQWQTSRGIFRVEDFGNLLTIGTQDPGLQWQADVPWAKAGEVKILDEGDIAKKYRWHCERQDTSTRCIHSFFPQFVVQKDTHEALIPQHFDLVGR